MAPNLVTVAVTEDGGMMKITDPKLFKAIETAIASGNTVYLITVTLTTSQWVMGRSS